MEFTARTRACLFLSDQAEQAADRYVSLFPDSSINVAGLQAAAGGSTVHPHPEDAR